MQRKDMVTNMEKNEKSVSDAKLTFEQAAARVDEIVRLLEKGDAPLDQSLALFEEGAKLIKECGKMLDSAEQTVVRLQKGVNDEPVEVVFDAEE